MTDACVRGRSLSIADGTIIEDRDYCSDPKRRKDFSRRAGSAAAFEIERVQTHYHYKSERDRSRGLFTLEQYRAVEAEVLRQLGDGLIDAILFLSPTLPASIVIVGSQRPE